MKAQGNNTEVDTPTPRCVSTLKFNLEPTLEPRPSPLSPLEGEYDTPPHPNRRAVSPEQHAFPRLLGPLRILPAHSNYTKVPEYDHVLELNRRISRAESAK